MASIDAVANLDANGKVMVNMPLNAAQAGYSQLSYLRSSTAAARVWKITDAGEGRMAQSSRLFFSKFNGANAGALVNNQWNQQLTTMASALNGGFLRLNSGAITTINTGISINTNEVFTVTDESSLKIAQSIRHSAGSASVSNKQMDFGWGYYVLAANQAGAMIEFVGFRWTLAGALIGVVEYSTGGGAPTTVTTSNFTIPSDNVDHMYEVVMHETAAEFWIDGVMQGFILAQSDAPMLTKGSAYPVINRLFTSGSAPATAPVFDIGTCAVIRIGSSAVEHERDILQVLSGRHLLRAQAGIQAASGTNVSRPASGTSPGALVPSNTVSGLVGTGGWAKATLTGVTATLHSELIMCSFANPAFPVVAGALSDGKAFMVTDIFIGPLIVTTILAGGGFSAQWFAAFGSTALSLATADAIGGAAAGTKAPQVIPLPIIDTLAATAAVGVIATRSGEAGHIPLKTPIPVHPGEFFHVGLRTLFVTAAVTSGAADYGIGVNGYWVE